MTLPKRTRPKRPVGRPRIDSPHPIDIHVGQRVRLRRTLLGMSQERLGEAVGLTFQQIQKYERGTNRIGASRLYDLSCVLDVVVSYFFDGAPDPADGCTAPPSTRAGASDRAARDPMNKRETLELVRAYYRIGDPALRKRLFELTKAIASGDSGASEPS